MILILAILILVIVIVILVICHLNVIGKQPTEHKDKRQSKIEWPPHQFITWERIGLTVHYMSHEPQSSMTSNAPIESPSSLQIWYFNKFNRPNPHNRTMLFFIRDIKLTNYRWLIDLCRQININLAIIFVQPSLIHEIHIARNWSPDQLILATDDDSSKLEQFISHDSELRKARHPQYHIASDNLMQSFDRPVSMRDVSVEESMPNYRAIILFNQDNPIHNEELSQSANRMIIISNQPNPSTENVHSIDWSNWYHQSTIDLDSKRNERLKLIVESLSDAS